MSAGNRVEHGISARRSDDAGALCGPSGLLHVLPHRAEAVPPLIDELLGRQLELLRHGPRGSDALGTRRRPGRGQDLREECLQEADDLPLDGQARGCGGPGAAARVPGLRLQRR